MNPPAGELPDIEELSLEAAAGLLQRMLRALRDGGRIRVRPGSGHLTIEKMDEEGARIVMARAVPVAAWTYRLMILRAPGRWGWGSAVGTLEEIADGILELIHLPPERAGSTIEA